MNYNNLRGLLSNEDRSSFEGEKVRLLAIGSPEGVHEVIHALHSLGYAEAGLWSDIMIVPNETKVMSILTRNRRRR